MKRLTLISISILVLASIVFAQDIVNETGKDGKFIVRDSEQNEAFIIEGDNVEITGELMIENMPMGEATDYDVVWDKETKRLRILPRGLNKNSPLSKPLENAAENYSVMDPILPIDNDEPLDQVILDDLIVDGSACIGFIV